MLKPTPTVVAAGVDVFIDARCAPEADVRDVDWRPPGFGDPADLTRAGPRPAARRQRYRHVERLMAAGSHLVGVRPAREVIGLEDALLHAGRRSVGRRQWPVARRPDRGLPVRGWASTVEEAERVLAAGEIALAPCHHHRAVGPMAGVTSPSMWMWC